MTADLPSRPTWRPRGRFQTTATEYTFTLRRGVEWHDGPQFECGGGAFTANDVVATYNRIIDPPEGMISLRKELMVDGADLREIVAIDDHTVKFILGSPRTTLVPALASGWNMVVSEKYLGLRGQ